MQNDQDAQEMDEHEEEMENQYYEAKSVMDTCKQEALEGFQKVVNLAQEIPSKW